MTQQLILVVDDDEDVRTMLSEVLAAEGYSTVTAANGLEALDRMRKNKPSLLFVDLMMPQMDGEDLIRIMKQDPTLARIPIAIMSGHKSAEAPRPVNACLVKPFELDRLMDVVHQLAH
jgi:CheY-like chemotaxis protein